MVRTAAPVPPVTAIGVPTAFETEVTVPEPLPLNVVQSVELKKPFDEELAAVMVRTTAVLPDTVIGVPVAFVTVLIGVYPRAVVTWPDVIVVTVAALPVYAVELIVAVVPTPKVKVLDKDKLLPVAVKVNPRAEPKVVPL